MNTHIETLLLAREALLMETTSLPLESTVRAIEAIDAAIDAKPQEPRDERAAFEAWCVDKFICGDYSFARSNGVYVHTVSHPCEPSTYASVMMLWEAWQAAKE
jgi:hypothetical protein